MATATRLIAVRAKAPDIRIDSRLRLGAPGSDAAFHWKVKGAREAWVEAPSRPAERVPLHGGMAVTIGEGREEFKLRAVGFDGGVGSVSFAAEPWLLDCLGEPGD
jgi:hypothetical protein